MRVIEVIVSSIPMALKCLMTLVAVGLAAATTPATARREPGTIPLLTTIENKGVLVRYDPPECTSDIRGQYSPTRVEMWFCTGAPTARRTPEDHNTVRHEAWHYLQHCRHGGPRLKTFYTSQRVFTDFISAHVSVPTYRYYTRLFSGTRRLVELEAQAAANAYSSSFINTLIQKYC